MTSYPHVYHRNKYDKYHVIHSSLSADQSCLWIRHFINFFSIFSFFSVISLAKEGGVFPPMELRLPAIIDWFLSLWHVMTRLFSLVFLITDAAGGGGGKKKKSTAFQTISSVHKVFQLSAWQAMQTRLHPLPQDNVVRWCVQRFPVKSHLTCLNLQC